MIELLRRLWRWSLDVPLMWWLRMAAVLTLIALALMVWSLFDPTLIPIIIGMSLAQVFGTGAFVTYGIIVFRDITRKRRAKRTSMPEIPT